MIYEELIEEIKTTPKTLLPSLLIELITHSHAQGVFRDNNPMPFLEKAASSCKIDCGDCKHTVSAREYLFTCSKELYVESFGNRHFCKGFQQKENS